MSFRLFGPKLMIRFWIAHDCFLFIREVASHHFAHFFHDICLAIVILGVQVLCEPHAQPSENFHPVEFVTLVAVTPGVMLSLCVFTGQF